MKPPDFDRERIDSKKLQSDDIDSVIAQLRAIQPLPDGRASAEEVTQFFRLFGLEPPSNDLSVEPPSDKEIGRLRTWIENPKGVTESERIEFFRAFHHSAIWRAVVSDLLRDFVLRTHRLAEEKPKS